MKRKAFSIVAILVLASLPVLLTAGVPTSKGGSLEPGALTMKDNQSIIFGNTLGTTFMRHVSASGDTTLTVPAAKFFNVVTGNEKIGTCTENSATMNGQDILVCGDSEFNGSNYFDGMIYADAGVTIATTQNLTLGAMTVANVVGTGDTTITGAAANDIVGIAVGNLEVGVGAEDLTMNGDDGHVVGTFEVDGVARFDTGITTGDASMEFTTNDKLHKTVTSTVSYVSATEIRVTPPFAPRIAVGLAAGAEDIGSTLGFVRVEDAADFIRFSFSIPELATLGAAGDLKLEFEIDEQEAAQGDYTVVIYKSGSTVAALTDTVVAANDNTKGWKTLVTNVAGFGHDADFTVGDSYTVVLQAATNDDNFDLYRVRMTYAVGIENDAT